MFTFDLRYDYCEFEESFLFGLSLAVSHTFSKTYNICIVLHQYLRLLRHFLAFKFYIIQLVNQLSTLEKHAFLRNQLTEYIRVINEFVGFISDNVHRVDSQNSETCKEKLKMIFTRFSKQKCNYSTNRIQKCIYNHKTVVHFKGEIAFILLANNSF